MKKSILYIASFLVSVSLYGQATDVVPSATQNHVHRIVYKKGVQESGLGSVSTNDKVETISYYDGLGRSLQTVGVRLGGKDGSSNDTDVYSQNDYDGLGRQSKSYLPFSSSTNNGKFDPAAITKIHSYYETNYSNDIVAGNSNPYSEKEYEASPLSRVQKQGAPGEAWKLGNGHEVEFEYHANATGDVRLYTVDLNNDYVPTLQNAAPYHYTEGELYKTIMKDENHSGTTKDRTIEEFKDKHDRVALKRTYNGGVAHDTYYVYDSYGNLTYVLPPKVVHDSSISATELSELCYQYRYDKRNRLIAKKDPGKGDANTWEEIVYDKLDRPILTRDPNLKAQGKWLFTKYDAFGRVVYTGLYGTTNSRINIQNYVNGLTNFYETKGSTLYNYTNNVYPVNITSNDILTVNYYDDYNFDRDGLTVPSSNAYGSLGTTISGTNLKSLSTGSKVKVLNTSSWRTTVMGYDEHRRPIWVGTKNNYLGTTDYIESKIKNATDDIAGLLHESKTTHIKSGTTIITIDKFAYDHSGNVLTHTNKINSQPEQYITVNEYDELGLLDYKKIGGTANDELQVVNYFYNIRGWLTGINEVANIGTSDLFAFKINYNTPTSGTALFNGNISQTQWKTKSSDTSTRTYNYTYDALNRITSGLDNTTDKRYSLTNVSYDKNGNILNLKRNGHRNATHSSFGIMDDLTYSYLSNSNKLMRVADAATIDQFGFKDDAINTASDTTDDYSYDTNGSMKTDTNKGITNINYNHFNLPTLVNFGSTNKIEYFYDANGVKVKKKVTDAGVVKTTDYSNNHVYENNTLQFFNHPEGYITPNGSSFTYVYQFKDHLGNVRLSYADSDSNGTIATSEIIEEDNYYPFGLKHEGYNTYIGPTGDSKAQHFKFNGKEIEKSLGYNMYEMDMRSYDPAIARWTTIDPVTHHSNSTYNGYDNNPIFWADPSGADVVGSVRSTGIIRGSRDIENSRQNGIGPGAETDFDNSKKSKSENEEESTVSNSSVSTNNSGGDECPVEPCDNNRTDQNPIPIGDIATSDKVNNSKNTNNSQSKHIFKKGESVFTLKEFTLFGAGEGISVEFGSLKISTFAKGLNGQEISSSGIATGGGIGSPFEVFAATRGKIILDQDIAGNNLEELFSSTKFITIRSYSAALKRTEVTAYTDSSLKTKLWHANLNGIGVITLGAQGSRYNVNFTNTNK